MSLADVSKAGNGLPGRYVVHGPEGCGKTSFAAATNGAIFVETRGETGLETLIDAGRLGETPHFPEVLTWEELLGAVDAVLTQPHEYKTLCIDTLNGAERLCHEYICMRDFAGDWGERGFASYGRGAEVSLAEWRELLTRLDAIRSQRQMRIFALCHTRVRTFKNPEGADYDRYSPDMNDKTWSLTHKWADFVGFINFETFVDQRDETKKGKAKSSQARILHTERHAAYDAKNRLGLPVEIDMGTSGQEAWSNFTTAIKAAKGKSTNGK